MDDERIIELFLARDEGAVTAASEKYGAYCRAVALGMLGDERDAQRVNGDVPRDAAQEGPEAARLAQKGAHFGGYQHMKNDRLSRCLGDIDEKFIDEAADYKKKGRKRGVYYLAAALAACILIVVAAQVRPSGVAEPRPATESPGPGSIAASPDAGVYIPAIELPETQDGLAMDMIACVVYNGAVYTQGAWLEDAPALLGEYLGRATGGIDEWSDESEYGVEFAGTVAGELYAVKGYDTGFRICCLNDDGSALLLERLNGITLDTGADLFETRLHLPERLEALSFLTHEDWNKAAKNYRTPELSEETVSAFLDELCAGKFVYTWESERGIYDSAVQGHLFCALSDGTTVELRLIEGGYVGYQELGWYFVKMPGDVFDAVLAACQ